MTQFQFYKSVLFVAELFVSEALFVSHLKRRNAFWLRISLGVLLTLLFAFLLPSRVSNAVEFSLLFFLIFMFSVAVGAIAFDESFFTIFFCCVAGYTTQHLAYELFNLFNVFFNGGASDIYGSNDFTAIFPNFFVFITYVFSYFVSYFGVYWAFARRIRTDGIKIERMLALFLSVFIFVIDIFLNALIVFNPAADANLYLEIIGVLNILCCFISLYLQFEIAVRKKSEDEFAFQKQLFELQKKHYEEFGKNIEFINMKCHDLKHQIHNIGGASYVDEKTLSDIKRNLQFYDSTIKTGNIAIDTVLTEKSLLCDKEQISFSCVVDGESLSYMSSEDIYSLFGNIIDNAIEAVSSLEVEKRVITLQARVVNGMLVLRERNYFSGTLEFLSNGLPKTKKSDKNWHGVGMKSIKHICEKYDGEMSIRQDNGIFYLDILFYAVKKQPDKKLG